MAAVHYPGTPGTILYGGRAAVAPGSDLTTLTLQNESASVQAAGFVSPMFGMPFKQGDMPAGSCPRFELADGTLCPATLWGVTSWPDGSMKFCGAMIRVPAAVPGSGTLAITVKSGGIAPGASARSTADLTAADIKVELTGVTNLSGTWTATLNDAITNGTAVLLGDGPAGALWRILGDFKQSGSPHGQLVCWHYVLAAQNSSGGLLGIRYLGRVAQPWADVSTPTPTRRVVNAVLKAGVSTLRTLQGHDTTETPGANIGMPHYTSFFTAGTDGRWDFVQGGGSASADCTVRVQHDKTYVVQSRLVPPYNITISPTSSASVNYVPYCQGSAETRSLDSTGPSNFIGVLPQWAVTHLLTQAAVDERAVRVSSLAAGAFRVTARRSTTKQVIPVADISASYTGLGTIQTTWRFGGSFFVGVQTPTDTTSLWSGDTNSSHRGSFHYYPYLITGEPQFLDMLVETAAQVVMATPPGPYTRKVGSSLTSLREGPYQGFRDITIGAGGATYKGAGVFFIDGGARISAWSVRDLAQAVAIYPDTSPDGVAVNQYLTEVLSQGCAAVNDLNSKMPQSWRDAGLFSTTSETATSSGSDGLYESPWMTMYLSATLCHAHQITGISEAETLRQHLSKFISAVNSQMDVTCLTAYRWNQWKADGTLVDSADNVLFYFDSTLTFSTATERATLGGARSTWTPKNGDKFSFSTIIDVNKPFASASNNTVFYAVNASGQTFQLAATPGGAAIDVTSAVTVSPYFAAVASASPLTTLESGSYYQKLAYEAARFHEACGDSNVSAARAKLDLNIAAAGISFTSDPRSAVLNSYPA